MNIEILQQVLIVVFIIVGILLIINLWRLISILGNIEQITSILTKRAKELDEGIEKAKQTLCSTVEAIKTFLFSFDIIKNIRNKFKKESNGQ